MNDWIEWSGGECPVEPDTVVEYKTRSGFCTQKQAKYIIWWYWPSRSDVIAYRIVDEAQMKHGTDVTQHIHKQKCEHDLTQPTSKKYDTYDRPFTNRMKSSETFDVYDVLVAFGVTCPMRQHAIKKLLAAGQRNGGKSELQDLQEALWSIQEAIKEKGDE